MSKPRVKFANAEMPGRKMDPENQEVFDLLTAVSAQNARETIASIGRADFWHAANSRNPAPRVSGTKVLPHNPIGKVPRTQAEIEQAQQNLNARFMKAKNDSVASILCHLKALKPGEVLSQREIASLFTADDKLKYKGVLSKVLLFRLLASSSLSKHQIDTLLELYDADQPPTPLNCPEAGLPTAAFIDPDVIANLAAENEAQRRAEAAAARAAAAEKRERELAQVRQLRLVEPVSQQRSEVKAARVAARTEAASAQSRRPLVHLSNFSGGKTRRTKRKSIKTRKHQR